MNNIFKIVSLYSTLMMASIPNRTDALLFCLNPDINQLEIIENKRTNHLEINNILEKYNVSKIESWLPNARPNEKDGDIIFTSSNC